MTSDRPQILSGMTTRQKATAGVFALILIVLIWQIWGLFSGGGSSSTPVPTSTAAKTGISAAGPVGMPQPVSPQPAALSKTTPAVMSQREAEMLKMQEQNEAQYISALNELQMLKLQRDIADTNKAIMSARFDTISAQKNIVDLLKPPPEVTTGNYAQGLVKPVGSGTSITGQPGTSTASVQQQGTTTTVTTPPVAIPPPDANYSVISVSQLLNRWSAVIGYQGNLYNVYVADVLPPDQSKVISIDRSGVILERNGIRRKVSLVPLI